jgi:hypothetical protein
MINEPEIGTPSMPISSWLERYAEENYRIAKETLLPWKKIKYRARSTAFLIAADMVRDAHGNHGVALHKNPELHKKCLRLHKKW